MACFRCVVLISLCCGLFPLCRANFRVLRPVSVVLWACFCCGLFPLCCGLFTLCRANLSMLRLVYVVLG